MVEQGLVKKCNYHPNHGSVSDDETNILKRAFDMETINQRWYTNVTYIHVQKDRQTYFAFVVDLSNRKIIGYVCDDTTMTTELAVKAIENVCLSVRDTKGIILYSGP